MDYRVLKFGGASVRDATAIEQVLRIVTGQTNQGPAPSTNHEAAPSTAQNQTAKVVVLSAMGGITDLLLQAANAAAEGRKTPNVATEFADRYNAAAKALIADAKSRKAFEEDVETSAHELTNILSGLEAVEEVTPGILDRTAARGERLMAKLFAATLADRGHAVQFVDAMDLIAVARKYGSNFPDLEVTRGFAKERVMPALDGGAICVIPGFFGRGENNKLVTLGRGGTDLSATTIAHAIRAKEVVLYKEVDGLLTADPGDVAEARIVPELHYREAAELAYYGAKVLHSRTIIPLLEDQIPLIIRNTFRPDTPGTRIAGDVRPGAFPVKALTAIPNQALIAVEGKGMLGVPGIAARTFQALANAGTSVSVISQSSSEASICFSVAECDAESAQRALQDVFQFEIEHRLIEEIRIKRQQSVLAVVGLGMRGTPGISARTFSALAKADVNIEAIAQGSSELNISVVVNGEDVENALNGLHREFRLEKLRALPPRDAGGVSVSIFGFGQIGRTLIRQMESQANYFQQKMDLDLSVIGLTDSSGMLLDDTGFSFQRLRDLALYKERGESLLGTDIKQGLDGMRDRLHQTLWTLPLERGVFCDLTAEDTAPILLDALKAGSHVVLANKKPLAVAQADFDELFETASKRGVQLRYEATVGAGLPILDTLSKLAEVGDPVISILGCLSGTLGYLMTEIEDGALFSEAVHKAYSLGYTEPDPREDLSGMDVARKALILARTLGKRLDLSDLNVEALFPKEADHDDPKEFLKALTHCDATWTKRIADARKEQKVLRYVARIDETCVEVGIEAVPADSPLGRLRGTDNQICIRTRRYTDNPLIVTGPGAGAEVTAAGVLNDVLAIATTLERRA